jgi:hypothetical protein
MDKPKVSVDISFGLEPLCFCRKMDKKYEVKDILHY